LEVLPVNEGELAGISRAAQWLQEAVQTGGPEPAALSLLALAYKRQDKIAEARATLQQIQQPDANVWWQRGLLSLRERETAQAEQEFSQAWQLQGASYPIGYNLLLTRLELGRLLDAARLAPRITDVAVTTEQRRLHALLQVWLDRSLDREAARLESPGYHLTDWTAEDERSLLRLVRSLGHTEVAFTMLQTLAEARPNSLPVQEAFFEIVLLKARARVDRGEWVEARPLLTAAAREGVANKTTQAAQRNLFGCCSLLIQDFDQGLASFQAAAAFVPGDANVQQNLALAYELKGDAANAEPHWNRYLGLLDRARPLQQSPKGGTPASLSPVEHADEVRFEILTRLGSRHAETGDEAGALVYFESALELRPNDVDLLERLFHVHARARRPERARQLLDQLRSLKPHEPLYDCYELDLAEFRSLSDIDHLLGAIDRLCQRYPRNSRVEEYSAQKLGDVASSLRVRFTELSERLSKVVSQLRRLPRYQIDWRGVRDVTGDLRRELQKLRRILRRCLDLTAAEERQRGLRTLGEQIDRKLRLCESIGDS
jgi:Flp pilus assembly protein TadD